jgi:predicted regulator of amino acid metabolism with ACT domain
VRNVEEYSANSPSQLKVAQLMMKHGVSVRDYNAYVGEIKLTDAGLAQASGVDRRVVRSTIERISLNPDLKALFSKIGSMAVLTDAASLLGCTSVEVVPEDDGRPGLLAGIMNIFSAAGINIRQAVVSGESEDTVSHLAIVVDGEVPGSVLAAVRGIPGVSMVILR